MNINPHSTYRMLIQHNEFRAKCERRADAATLGIVKWGERDILGDETSVNSNRWTDNRWAPKIVYSVSNRIISNKFLKVMAKRCCLDVLCGVDVCDSSTCSCCECKKNSVGRWMVFFIYFLIYTDVRFDIRAVSIARLWLRSTSWSIIIMI